MSQPETRQVPLKTARAPQEIEIVDESVVTKTSRAKNALKKTFSKILVPAAAGAAGAAVLLALRDKDEPEQTETLESTDNEFTL